MGNRALITTDASEIALYLHWNGGRDSVEAFLRYQQLAQLPELLPDGRGLFYLGVVAANFFGNDGLNVDMVRVNPFNLEESSPGDQGIYVVQGYDIVDRLDAPGFEQHIHEQSEMLKAIDEAQSEKDQLGVLLDSVETPVADVKLGDQVAILDHFNRESRVSVFEVIGFGTERVINGGNVNGLPYVGRYPDQDNSENINSYLQSEHVWVVPTLEKG